MTKPSHEQKLTEVSERIYELVPRLKELSFGCKILSNQKSSLKKPYDQIEGIVYHNYGYTREYVIGDRSIGEENYYRDCKTKGQEISAIFFNRYNNPNPFGSPTSERRKFNTKVNFVEIIGHPIRLEDVLEACEKSDQVKTKVLYAQDSISDIIPGICFKWQYGKPLSQQSQETVSFLYDIFFNNK